MRMLHARPLAWALASPLLLAGCQSQSQLLDANQAMAEQTALSRGQFEMNCPAATPTILSREVVQPALQGTQGCSVLRLR
jgi:hypothetical protein